MAASATRRLGSPLASPDGELGKGYQVLSQVAPLVLERQGFGKVTAVLVDADAPKSKVRLGDYAIEARFARRSQVAILRNRSPFSLKPITILR